jgi:predicted dehydrogenase
MEPAFSYQGIKLTAQISGERQPIEIRDEGKAPSQFQREAEHFADSINENKEPKANGEEGLRNMKLMMDLYASCKRNT